MTVAQLQKQIRLEADKINKRLASLEKIDFVPTSVKIVKPMINHGSGWVKKKNDSFRVSAKTTEVVSTKKGGRTTKPKRKKELEKQLKFLKNLAKETETKSQAVKKIKETAEKEKISYEEAQQLLKTGRVFDSVMNNYSYMFDSKQIQSALESFDKTPSFSQLIDRCMEMFGREIQDDMYGADELLKWMNNKMIIPEGVQAHFENGSVVYDD